MRPTTLWRLARLEGDVIVFRLYDEIASRVEVFGSWSDWSIGTPAHKLSTRLWEARVPRTDAPQVAYKLLLDGALPFEERTRFEQHLVTCPGCTEYLRQIRQTIRASSRLMEEEIPDALKEDLLDAFRDWRKRRIR